MRGDGGKQATASLEIVGPLGAGGFGAVYEAIDTRTGQRVAVKELDDPSGEGIARFKQEYRVLADCHHAHLVGLKELIEQDGRWLIVMELVPGSDFLRYVRRADNDNDTHGTERPLFDEARLRSTLVGMAEGLRALHAYGVVHRDLKPSNVRVRPDGHAVLLDFGLATRVDPKEQPTHGLAVGTVAYMAPEQARGRAVGPEADLYALGVCLFEALTGRRPFEGDSALSVMLEKQQRPAPRARSLAPSAPQDLDDLCARLLALEPNERPSAEQVLALLTDTPLVDRRALSVGPAVMFAGREGELGHLRRALARTHVGEQRLILIEGESGVGKSELVSEFLRQAQHEHTALIALRGRCYESEQLAYKAFDGCIDELAKALRDMRDSECRALMPERATLLGQLFPVLQDIEEIAEAPRVGSSADPSARRLQAFAALSQLLSKLAEERPLVLVLDDLQWADVESFRLLRALHDQPAPAPILFLATVRPRAELEEAVDVQLERIRSWRETDTISLSGLPLAQAKALAGKLLGEAAPSELLELIAQESQGHPLFMGELARHAGSSDFPGSALTIDAALRARIENLMPRERELLELVAVAARPYPAPVFAQALSLDIDESRRALLTQKLLRQRRGEEIGCFHDRIRQAALAMIPPARLAVQHYQLAVALALLPGGDASEQARHWDLAGQPERASKAYEHAAQRALDALAFMRAAALFERALSLLSQPSPQVFARLTSLRADALAWAGRSAEAAHLYGAAAERAEGEQRIVLRSQAARHLILGAKIAEGLTAARALLGELGFHLPGSALGMLLRVGWDAVRLWWRGDQLARHTAPEDERAKIEAARELLSSVALVHPLAYLILLRQYLLRALRSNSPHESVVTFAMLGWFRAFTGRRSQARAAFDKAERLLNERTNPVIVARQRYLVGSSYMAAFDWAGSLMHLQEAERIAHDHCKDNPALLTIIRYHLGGAWFHVGDHAQLARELERWLAEARERNDVLSEILLSGMGHGLIRHLMRDAPADALAELERFQRAIPATPYSFAHLGQLMTGTVCHAYLGGGEALRFLDAHEAEHARAFMLKSSTGRQALLILRTLAALSASASCSERERPVLLAKVKASTRALTRWRSTYVQAFVALADAQIAAVEGQREQALSLTRKAGEGLRALRHAQRRGAHFLEGLLEGGPAGQAKRDGVLAELRREGWQDPVRSIRLHAPLCALLMESPKTTPPRPSLLRERYHVLQSLGRGGFGSVVAARDEHSGRTLALKELVAKGGMPLERFKQEFRALADLHHEHLIQLEELFENEGSWYIAMELVSGVDLVSYVRADGSCDAQRLRRSVLGVAQALGALHRSGFVHRDVKPENILITSDGRPVLIDLGLLGRLGDERDAQAVGSIEYAAPEQLAGAVPSAAADVYGLGACLYAAISGQPPLASEKERFSAKRRAPTELTPPTELSELALLTKLMLSPSPEARPTLDALIDICKEDAPPLAKGSSLTRAGLEETGPDSTFKGRERERAELRERFQESRQGARLVLIEGESGLGKSALAAEFAARLREQRPALLIVSARCYESEQVAFKAFDRVVDMLAGHLRGLSRASCEQLLPKQAALLAQLFPVLSSVPAIAAAPRKGLPADPTARKQRAVAAFVSLLEKLCAQEELLIVIDDLQWADRESFALLQRLLARPAQLPLMILCTVRPRADLEATSAEELAALRSLACASSLALGTLEAAAARALAERLLGDGVPQERLAALVAESKGHPLFLRELIVHEQRGAGSATRAATLDEALAARVAALSPTARDLLALVALADKPHGSHVFARALGLAELPREALVALLGQGLLRRRGERIAWYHDRIRPAALAQLGAERRARFACDLARALGEHDEKSARANAAERARLWHEGGEPSRAVAAYEQAGDVALEGFAFAVAAGHYERALTLLGEDGEEATRRRVLTARGHALARAGRSAEAARMFQEATQYAVGEERVRLQIWVAQHLIQSAQVGEGLNAARGLLNELGIKLAASDRQALHMLMWQRMRGKVGGRSRAPRAASGREQLALEALHGLSQPVRAVSLLPGAALVGEYLTRARDLGDPRHSARALAYKGMFRGMKRGDDKREALFAEAHRLAESTGDQALIAEVDLTHGFALVTQHQNHAAPPYLLRAHERLLAHCPGQPWLLTSARVFLGQAWFYTHRFQELRSHAGVWLEEARARDDRYAVAALAGLGAASVRFALDEQPELALAELETAMAPWADSAVTTAHVGAYLTATAILASNDDGQRYLSMVERETPRIARAILMRSGEGRYWLHGIRAQALLKSVRARAAPDTPQLLRRARAELRGLRKLHVLGAATQGDYLEAWLRMLEGDQAGALQLARRAHEALVALGQPHQLMTLYLVGALEGGQSGSTKCAQARAGFEAEGWRDWRRGLALRLPGRFDVLERERAR